MADTITITDADGNDVVIDTDDTGASGHVQIVKLAIATDGSATLIPADASGLLVKNPTTASNFYVNANGAAAHDASGADSGGNNPVRIGGVYSSAPSKVSASGDIVSLRLTQDGKILDIHSAPAAATTNVNQNYSSAQTNVSLVSAPGANKRLVIVELTYSRDTAGNMKLVEDPAGTPATKWGQHYFSANGGVALSKIYVPLTANKALGMTSVGGGNESITMRVITEEV